MRDDVRDWIALSLTTGIGPMTAQKVLKRFGFPGAVFRANRQQFEGIGLSEDTREAILSQNGYREADAQLLWLQQQGASAITIQDAEYPLHLREIPDPPIVLYFKGDLTSALEQPCVAIVGARHCSTYG
ncbi:MAG TPA: DNA-processing protein DprA, partial [Acidobacteriota bacterium]|nr:DNA-processing protein DprA [Acidobacteriota bacterium]